MMAHSPSEQEYSFGTIGVHELVDQMSRHRSSLVEPVIEDLESLLDRLRALVDFTGTDRSYPRFRAAKTYVVLRILVTPVAGDPSDAAHGACAHRTSQRLTAAFDTWVEGQVLCDVDGEPGTVLLPVTRKAEGWDLHSRVMDIVADAGLRAEAGVVAAATVTEREEIPAAVTEADEVLRVVQAQGWPEGTYWLDDVMLEVQLSKPGPARQRLIALLDPLADSPDLLSTLSMYVQHDRNRKRTARLLHVHPNTVDYRLRRVSELTGLDLHTAGDFVRVSAALIAMRAASGPE